MSLNRVLSLLALIVMSLSCGKSPSDVYTNMVAAAKEQNIKQFSSYFTEDSQPVVKGIISLANNYGIVSKNPLKYLGTGEAKHESISDKYAVVEVQHKHQTRKILFIQDKEGEWKIDPFKLE